MIKEVVKHIQKTICIEPAKMVYRDTGRKTLKTEIDESGNKVEVEVPVQERVQLDAKYKDIVEEIMVYQVEYVGETHEFASREDAAKFMETIA